MIVDKLHLGAKKKVPHIYQAEMAECGHACLAMIASYHGHQLSMTEMRMQFPPSAKGSSLTELKRIADVLGFAARPVKLELTSLKELKLPAILHWDFSHFIVVTQVTDTYICINDPGMGERKLGMMEVSKHFTGVAMELTPSDRFVPRAKTPGLKMGQLIGRVRGFFAAGGQILVAAMLLELVGLAMPWLNQLVTDNVLVNADSSLLTVLGVGFLMLVVLRAALTYARDWSLSVLSTGIRAQVAEKVLRHTLKLPAQFFERRRASDLANRFESLANIERTLAATFIQTVLDSAFALIIVAVLFAYSATLGSLVLGCAVVYGLIRWTLYEPTRQAQLNYVEAKSKQDASLLESLRAILPIQLADKGTWRLAQWEVHLADATNAQIRQSRLETAGHALSTLLFGAVGVVFLWLGAREVLDGKMTVGALFAVVAYQQGVAARLAALVDSVAQFKLLSIQLERLADIVYAQERAQVAVQPSDTGIESLSFELRNVTYRYSPSEPKILDDVSLVIPAGQNLCFAGHSGCGKSTLLKLMVGVMEPTEGVILVNGKPLAEFGVDRLRAMCSVVLQDDTLFYGSVADNISYFDPDATPESIAKAATSAAVAQEIAAMPMQFQSLCGEGGSTLSGGQRQRIILARALYRAPRAIFLDEATSHLDTRTEQLVNESLKTLHMTRLAIAHRPETIMATERAVVLVMGKVLYDAPPADVMMGKAQPLFDPAELAAQRAGAKAPAPAPSSSTSENPPA